MLRFIVLLLLPFVIHAASCGEGGEWDGEHLTCVPKNCTLPDLGEYTLYHPMRKGDDYFEFGESVFYTCANVTHCLHGSPRSTCDVDNNGDAYWDSDPPVCSEDCDFAACPTESLRFVLITQFNMLDYVSKQSRYQHGTTLTLKT